MALVFTIRRARLALAGHVPALNVAALPLFPAVMTIDGNYFALDALSEGIRPVLVMLEHGTTVAGVEKLAASWIGADTANIAWIHGPENANGHQLANVGLQTALTDLGFVILALSQDPGHPAYKGLLAILNAKQPAERAQAFSELQQAARIDELLRSLEELAAWKCLSEITSDDEKAQAEIGGKVILKRLRQSLPQTHDGNGQGPHHSMALALFKNGTQWADVALAHIESAAATLTGFPAAQP